MRVRMVSSSTRLSSYRPSAYRSRAPVNIQLHGGGLEYLDIIPFGVEHVETAVRILPHAGGEIEQAHPFAPGRVAAETAKEMPLPVHDSDIARVVHHQPPPVVGDEEVAAALKAGR